MINEATTEPQRSGHKWVAHESIVALIKDTIRHMRTRPSVADLERITALCTPTKADYESLLLWWDRIDKRRKRNGNQS